MSIESVMALADAKAKERTKAEAEKAQSIVIDLHRNAPRDSSNVNSQGENRSATLAAPDTRNLLDILSQPVQETSNGYRAAMNYDVLENGPLKRQLRELTKERLKREA